MSADITKCPLGHHQPFLAAPSLVVPVGTIKNVSKHVLMSCREQNRPRVRTQLQKNRPTLECALVPQICTVTSTQKLSLVIRTLSDTLPSSFSLTLLTSGFNCLGYILFWHIYFFLSRQCRHRAVVVWGCTLLSMRCSHSEVAGPWNGNARRDF